MTLARIDAPPRNEAAVASLPWVLAVIAVFGFVALWVWLLALPPLSASPYHAFPLALLVGTPAGIWGFMALTNYHRALLALGGCVTPILMVGLVVAALDDAAPPNPEMLTAGEWQIVGGMFLAATPVLAVLACSFRKGLRQAVARRAELRERRMAREADEQARKAEKERELQAEADRRAERKRRGELIEEATARMAERIAGGSPGAAGVAGSADDLAALALFQDIDRREALEEEEIQRERADTAEEELEKSREQVRKLKRKLLEQEVARMTVGLAADVVGKTLPGVTLGALYGGSRVGRAFDKIRGM